MKVINQKQEIDDMKNIQEKELKSLFDAGALTHCSALKNPMGEGWIMICNGKSDEYCLRSQRDVISKVFKTLDALKRKSNEIGFKKLNVVW